MKEEYRVVALTILGSVSMCQAGLYAFRWYRRRDSFLERVEVLRRVLGPQRFNEHVRVESRPVSNS